MKYKLIVADFDHTLCNSKKEVTPRTRKAIKSFQDKGGIFVIATTRACLAIEDIAKEIGLKDELITSQGALIKNLSTDEIIFTSYLSDQIKKDFFDYFKHKTNHIHIFAEDKSFAKVDNYFFKRTGVEYGFDMKVQNDWYKALKECNATTILIGSYSKKRAMRFEKMARHKFGKNYNIGICDKRIINIFNKDVSKGLGIQKVADIYGIKKDEIIAFGDSLGDKSMYDFAGTGVAMGNSMEKLKSYADYVCDTCDNDGLAKFIETNCL